MRRSLTLIISLFLSMAASAQDMPPIASTMESHLKINVVVAVLVIIFMGIIGFLIALDKRLTKLEEGK